MQSRMSMVSGKWQKLYPTSKVATHWAQYTSTTWDITVPTQHDFSHFIKVFFSFYKRIKALMKPNSNFYNQALPQATSTNSKWCVQKDFYCMWNVFSILLSPTYSNPLISSLQHYLILFCFCLLKPWIIIRFCVTCIFEHCILCCLSYLICGFVFNYIHTWLFDVLSVLPLLWLSVC